MALRQLVLCLIAVCCGSLAYGKPKRDHCDKRELSLKSCIINKWRYTVRFTDKRFTINNKVHRGVFDIPVVGESVQWDRVQMWPIGKRKFLELRIWDDPKTEASIQNLKWIIFELVDGAAHLKLNKTIQKRRVDLSTKKEIYDRPQKAGIRTGKRGQVFWFIDREKGSF